MNTIESVYKDKQYCFAEILRVREAIGTVRATRETYDAAQVSLGFMLLYCPDEILSIVQAAFDELSIRMGHAILRGLIPADPKKGKE